MQGDTWREVVRVAGDRPPVPRFAMNLTCRSEADRPLGTPIAPSVPT